MKTFKLINLKVVESNDEDLIHTEIPLADGLIINREDDDNSWVVEAYTSQVYMDYFKQMQEQEVMIQVKISKESNDPAVLLSSINEVNEIGSKMNIVFMGTIIDQRQSKIEGVLEKLVGDGYEGKELLAQFKKILYQQ